MENLCKASHRHSNQSVALKLDRDGDGDGAAVPPSLNERNGRGNRASCLQLLLNPSLALIEME